MRKLVFLIFVLFIFYGCTALVAPRYGKGDRVVSKVTGEEGWVVERDCSSPGLLCKYKVRFPAGFRETSKSDVFIWLKSTELDPAFYPKHAPSDKVPDEH